MKMVNVALLAMAALATACGTANQGGSEVKTVVNNPTYDGYPIILNLGQTVDSRIADEICKDQGFTRANRATIILDPYEKTGTFAVYGGRGRNITKKVLNNVQGNIIQKIDCQL